MNIIKARQPATEPTTGDLVRTTRIEEYVWEHGGFRYKMVIPKGYEFDGASIPRIGWTILGLTPYGKMNGPALPHDGGYEFRGKFPSGWLHVMVDGEWHRCYEIDKRHLDLLLRELVLYFQVAPKWKANAVWLAVKLFGRWAWHRNDKKRKDKKR